MIEARRKQSHLTELDHCFRAITESSETGPEPDSTSAIRHPTIRRNGREAQIEKLSRCNISMRTKFIQVANRIPVNCHRVAGGKKLR
jgi:hypothetical protein